MKHISRILSVLIVLASIMAVTTGCATVTAADSGRPAVIYFAAVEDYNTLKIVALHAVPTMDVGQATTILESLVRTDEVIHRIDELRAAGTVTDGDYSSAIAVLTTARNLLAVFVGENQ